MRIKKIVIAACAMATMAGVANAQCSPGDYINTCPVLNYFDGSDLSEVINQIPAYTPGNTTSNGVTSSPRYRYGTFVSVRLLPIQARGYVYNYGLFPYHRDGLAYTFNSVGANNVFLYLR